MAEGYVKIYRSSLDNKAYYAEPFTRWQAWVDLLLLANYKDNIVYVRGIPVEVKRGQVLGGEEFLAKRWKWSRGKVKRFCSHLESKTVQQIVQQKSNVITVITIVNYELYQDNGTTDSTANSTTDGQQTDNRRTTDGHTRKKVKNSKESKEYIIPDFINKETWDAFLEVRKKKKNPNTPHSLELMVKKLERLKGEGYDVNALMEHAILRGWQDVVFDGNPIIPKPAPKPKVTDIKVLLAEQAKRDAERLEKEELANG